MSIDHYRNISLSAYIEYACFNCTGKFAENVLRIFPHFHVDFFLPMWPLLSKPLYISMGGEKMYFLVYKAIRNRAIWGPCQFLMLAPNALWKFYLSICLETWNHLYGRNLEKWRICMEHVKDVQKTWKTNWKNAEFDWTSERIYMEKRRIRLDKRKNLYGPTVF